jgi:hypothetical protein
METNSQSYTAQDLKDLTETYGIKRTPKKVKFTPKDTEITYLNTLWLEYEDVSNVARIMKKPTLEVYSLLITSGII